MRPCVVAGCLVALLFVVPSAHAQANLTPPSVVHTDVNVTVQAPEPDPEVIAQSSTQSFQAIVVQLVAPSLVGWVNDLLNMPDFLRQTPPDLTYNHEAIQRMLGLTTAAAVALLALAVFGAGAIVSLRQEFPIGRLIGALFFSAGTLAWWHIGIDINNAINTAISAPAITDIIRPHLTLPTVTSDPLAAFGPALLVIVYAFVALMLLVTAIFRIATIDILIVIGPLALFCMALPQSERFSTAYISLAVGTLFSQIMIVICLALAPVLTVIGSSVATTFISIAILMLARQAPTMLTNATTRTPGATLAKISVLMIARRLLRL